MARTKLLTALGPAAAIAGAVALALLLPVHDDQHTLPSLTLGLPVFAIIAMVVMLVRSSVRRLESAALMMGCALAIALAAAAVAATAETLDLNYIVLAQHNTGLYLLKLPVAAWIFVVALALGIDHVLLLLVFSGLGATLFLGGYFGGRLEGIAALLLKTACVALFVLAIRLSIRRVTAPARLAIAWAAAGAGLLNVVITLVQLGP